MAINVSSLIKNNGLNRVYSKFPIDFYSYVDSYSGLPASNIFYTFPSGDPVITPINEGLYTVVTTVCSLAPNEYNNDFFGTAVNILTVLNLNDTYFLPSSAKSSLIYFPDSIDGKKDIVISFDFIAYTYEGTGTEGFAVILNDASTFRPIITGGAPGKALGYTNLTYISSNNTHFTENKYTGKYRGSLGIGFDFSGNYGLSSKDLFGYSNKIPNSICLRDSSFNEYKPLFRTENLNSSAFKNPILLCPPIYDIFGQDEFYEENYTTARIRITNLGKKIIVDLKPLSAEQFTNYLNYELSIPLPPYLFASLSFSTGINNTFFLLKNFNLNCFYKSVTATADEIFGFFLSPPVSGYSGITYASYDLNDRFYYKPLIPSTLPLTGCLMDLYIDGDFTGSVVFDPVYDNKDFGYYDGETQLTYFKKFSAGYIELSGSNYLS